MDNSARLAMAENLYRDTFDALGLVATLPDNHRYCICPACEQPTIGLDRRTLQLRCDCGWSSDCIGLVQRALDVGPTSAVMLLTMRQHFLDKAERQK
jgi:hypothetical protein